MKSTTSRLEFFTEHKNADYLDLRFIESFPQSAQFKKSYGEGASSAIVVFDDYDPHQPAIFLCRHFLEDDQEIGSRGLFILALQICNSGTCVMVDLVARQDAKSYSNLAYQHLKHEGWIKGRELINHNLFHETMLSPFLFANGYFERVSSSEIKFVAEEGSYGKKILATDASEVATFINVTCTRHPCHARKLSGRNFFFEVGEFISENKLRVDFYEQLASNFLTTTGRLENRCATALLLMRALESAKKEKIDLPQAVIQEQRQGLGHYLEQAGGINLIFQDFD